MTLNWTLHPHSETPWRTLKRALALSPQFRQGLPLTIGLAVIATAGRILVPIAVQQTIDGGLLSGSGAEPGRVRISLMLAAVGVLLTACAGYALNVRLFRSTESGLATLRVRTFRRVHDLSVLTQNAERRGSLVSRVTSDVDTISTFMQWGGLLLIVSFGQLLVATVLMAIYSWQLTLVVWLSFFPLFLLLRTFQRRVSAAYAQVRERVGDLLAAVSESVVGAATIKAYASEPRTASRIDTAIDRHRAEATKSQALVALTFSSGEVIAGLANAAVVMLGVYLGVGGELTLGELLAFLFLVTLFVGPVQIGTEVLNEAQNALAGWRRVLRVLDTPADVADPGLAGVVLPRGPIDVHFEDVSYAYPGGPTVLANVDLEVEPGTRVAVVGETGSGKTTFAKLLTRLMDPVSGRVFFLDQVDLRQVSFESLRKRIVMVPQDGFLFTGTIGENIRFGRLTATEEELLRAVSELGLSDWLAALPLGLATSVGERGEQLSAGERQLVALVRAHITDPDLLVLDEATSAVDPATEVRIGRAVEELTHGRTAITIAHRLATAAAADLVVVFDAGRIVEQGAHADLVSAGGVYSRLYEAWMTRRSTHDAAPPRMVVMTDDMASASGEGGPPSALDPVIARRLKRDRDGLVAAVVQEHDTGEVLMVGWMNDEALHRTLATRRTTFWSRSRNAYWVKGETSGHVQHVREVALDCDGDTLLIKVAQTGPACHTGARSCFDGDVILAATGAS